MTVSPLARAVLRAYRAVKARYGAKYARRAAVRSIEGLRERSSANYRQIV